MDRATPGRVTVKVGRGRVVRLRDGRKLTDKSEPVTLDCSVYINRRLECGDLREVDPPSPSTEMDRPAAAAVDRPAAATPTAVKGA